MAYTAGSGPMVLQKAIQLHRSNNFKKAEKMYRSFLKANPHHPDAGNNLAVLLVQSGKAAAALPYFRNAIHADPANSEYWTNYIQALINLDHIDTARQVLAQGRAKGLSGPKADQLMIEIERKSALFDFNEIQKYFQQGQYDQVEIKCRKALAARPDDGLALKCLGTALAAQKKYKEGLSYLQKATQMLPEDADGHNSLGVLLKNLDRLSEAEKSYWRALELVPDYPHALNNLAVLFQETGKPKKALDLLFRAIQLRPDYPEAYFNLGNVFKALADFQKAGYFFNKALEKRPDYADAHINLGAVFQEMGEPDKAGDCYLTALELDPDNPELFRNMAALSQVQGRLDEAEKYCWKAIGKKRDYAEAYYVLSELNKLPNDEKYFTVLENIIADRPESLAELITVHFTLGRMYADAKNYDKAFEHYSKANTYRAGKFGTYHDSTIDHKNLEFFTRNLSLDFFENRRAWGNESEKPIFIIGMPRSGTTLIEQILTSHSLVCGAGELPYIKDYLLEFANQSGKDLTGDFVLNIHPEDAKKIAGRYLERISEIGGEAPMVTDKMPHNFEVLWLISLLFPCATIIHSVRNPVDTCLSCYFQNFSEPHPYKNDLISLADYYRYYQAVMDHWKKVLPVKIHDVVYEELVGDPETRIPKLLEICGLNFESACMTFYKNRRVVSTASSVQVRQKIYQSSVERWRRYEKHITPLLELL